MRHQRWILIAAILMSLLCNAPVTFAQNQPASTSAAASTTAQISTPPSAQGTTAILQMPKQLEVKIAGLPEPSSGPGWMGSLVIGAILSALSAIWTTIHAADRRSQLETALQQSRELHAVELANMARRHEDATKEQEQTFQREIRRIEHEHQKSSQHASLSREDQRIDTERRRLQETTNASALEIEVAVARLGREHEAEVAKLIHLYFEKLTSEQDVHRELALQALSEFVDVKSLRKLLVPNASVIPVGEVSTVDTTVKDGASEA